MFLFIKNVELKKLYQFLIKYFEVFSSKLFQLNNILSLNLQQNQNMIFKLKVNNI